MFKAVVWSFIMSKENVISSSSLLMQSNTYFIFNWVAELPTFNLCPIIPRIKCPKCLPFCSVCRRERTGLVSLTLTPATIFCSTQHSTGQSHPFSKFKKMEKSVCQYFCFWSNTLFSHLMKTRTFKTLKKSRCHVSSCIILKFVIIVIVFLLLLLLARTLESVVAL